MLLTQFNPISVAEEIDDLKAEIAEMKAERNEVDDEFDDEDFLKWNALLDSNPVQYVEDIMWAKNITNVDETEVRSIPIVKIGGLWGTICDSQGIDEDTYKFLCKKLTPGGSQFFIPIQDQAKKDHDVTESEYGKYPVLLNSLRCKSNSTDKWQHQVLWTDCTSGPMGYENCYGGMYVPMPLGDLQIYCASEPSSD